MALFAASCSNEDLEQMTKADVPAHPRQEIAKGIAPEITNLKSSDAEIVANRFVSFFNSRSEDRHVKNVVTIPNSEGEPALYAVNFDNGYVIVSASKNLPPIVADVDNGNFSLEDQPSGRDIIIQQLISESDYWRKNGGNDEYREEWRHFVEYPSEAPENLSRAEIQSDPWTAMYAQLIEFEDMGYECHRLYTFEDDQDFMPDEILAKFKSRAKHEDNIWEDEYGENFMYETAIVVKKDMPSYGSSTCCLNTQWAQGLPYNYMLGDDRPLGCVTIAVGQIMKYHQYPNTFNWSGMPDKLSFATNCVLTNFLKRIHDELGVDDNGVANIKDAERVLKSYGYHTSIKNHNNGSFSNLPAFCQGVDSRINEGHAWVCDGSSHYSFHTAYELYVFDNTYYPNFKYMLTSSDDKYSESQTLYHMNWGWGGEHDGYYMDNNISLMTKKYGLVNYKNSRKDIYITKP